MDSLHYNSRSTALRISAAALAALLAGCSPTDGIEQSGQKFEAISQTATINLVGNEPFWGVEIAPAADGGYLATYSTPENIEGARVGVKRFAGNNGFGFSGELDGAAMQITITPGDCNDTMSDRSYPYTSTVALGDLTLYGCEYTSDQSFEGGEAQ